MDDMTMTVYPRDSSAEAVVLMDYGTSSLFVTSMTANVNLERHVRIKILKKEGLNWANVQVKLYHSGSAEEKISSLKAVTYNLENGNIVESKMSKDAIFKEKFDRYNNIQKFTLPNVKEGSIIEYSYTLSSEFFTNFPNWTFQRSIPTRHSEYWANIPDFFIYQKYMQGYISAEYEMKPKAGVEAHHWTCKDVPAFKVEPYMTSEEDYISKVNFALARVSFPGHPTQEIMASWEKLNKDLSEDSGFAGVITGSGYLKKYAEEITAGITDPLQKIRAIHTYVKTNIEWNEYKDYYPDSPKKILENKKGTSGDINFLLGSLLEKAGFQVDMVLLSTRDHGFIRHAYPMTRQFNYVVVAIVHEGKRLFLDATQKYLPMETLPEWCLNGEGFLISKTRSAWVNLDTKSKTKTSISADLLLQPDGSLKGKIDFVRDGYDAWSMRNEWFSNGEEKYKKELYEGKPWELTSCIFEDVKEVEKPVKEKHEVIINEHVSAAGDAMYLNPFVISQMQENPFRHDKREYPVDFGKPSESLYICKITIPDGYSVDELPPSKVFMLPGNAARFVYNVSQTGNIVNFMSSLQINKALFPQTEYDNLRAFYNQVVAKHTEQIVLKKKQ
jgi:hypothetical protein